MRKTFLSIAIVLLGACSSDPGGGGPGDDGGVDPCERVASFMCADRPDYCDEVYTAESASQLSASCDPGSPTVCPFTQCCYHENGLYDAPSLHCVSTDVDPNYRVYCESHGGTYCPR